METASSVVAGLKVVGRCELFQKATDFEIKPVPETFKVKAPPPAMALAGNIPVMAGVGLKAGLLFPPQPANHTISPRTNGSAADRERGNPICPPMNSMGIPRPLGTSSREAKTREDEAPPANPLTKQTGLIASGRTARQLGFESGAKGWLGNRTRWERGTRCSGARSRCGNSFAWRGAHT